MLSLRRPVPTKLKLLAWVLICFGCMALNEMILWGASFRYWVLSQSTNIFFSLSVSFFCFGPLLWLWVQHSQHKQVTRYWPHFVPAVVFLGYLWLTFWLLPDGDKRALIESYGFDNNWHYPWVIALGALHRWGYAAAALRLLWPAKLISKGAELERQTVLVVLMCLLSIDLLIALIAIFEQPSALLAEAVATTKIALNYCHLILLNGLFFVMIKAMIGEPVPRSNQQPTAVNSVHVDAIEQAIVQQQLHLNPHLSVERFAQEVGLPAKDVSQTINRHFEMSFVEFINQHRITAAKQLLADANYNHLSITELFLAAGFNSKSVYNTLFKKKFNCTPSQFRKASQSATNVNQTN